ncbi:alpha/beta fold hydrolase [Paenibacillus protaetiae]|uniref:Alpha/beta hydrolase n=1 Tax=Paenibacillus protaetiae TaxID=2509456 RepID=A0A4P6EXE1_9BACL|nr:alpha/beta hydrolase [Paenibacillus protaetiae]QAY66893.1 alpha/beta hydrolase [Paenibacillus protaetiae]
MSNVSIATERMTLQTGLTIAYYDSDVHPETHAGKSGEKPAVVMLHGFCGSSAYWEQVVPLLQPHLRVIAPDLRGHGRSGIAGTEAPSIDRYADDVALMLEQLQPGPVFLLGHSLGGYITLAFADKYASKLAGFGLIHSTPLPDSPEAKAGRDKAVETVRTLGVAAFVEGLVPKLFAPGSKERLPFAVEQALAIGRETSAAGVEQAALAMKERPDRTGTLQNSPLPILLAAGKHDGVIPPERTFMKEGNNVQQVLLEQAGHMGMYEQPGKLAEAIRQFAGRE